jgi:hypothetical protein
MWEKYSLSMTVDPQRIPFYIANAVILGIFFKFVSLMLTNVMKVIKVTNIECT